MLIGCVFEELWLSLASLLRSYTALHGLSNKQQAVIEQDEDQILARHGSRWLQLRRDGTVVSWKREDGQCGVMELTEAGQLRSQTSVVEMDMAAEVWAGDLMRESQQ